MESDRVGKQKNLSFDSPNKRSRDSNFFGNHGIFAFQYSLSQVDIPVKQ